MFEMTSMTRSEMMSRVRVKNTAPELTIGRRLHRHGFRDRFLQVNLQGKPVIALAKHESMIFVNGCFWLGHHECRYFRMPRLTANTGELQFRRTGTVTPDRLTSSDVLVGVSRFFGNLLSITIRPKNWSMKSQPRLLATKIGMRLPIRPSH